MAQGAVKKSKPTAAPRKFVHPSSLGDRSAKRTRRPSKTGPRPGQKVIKPKKTSLITQNQIKKRSAAGLVGTTEKFLAEKAGHLEILRGGKKDQKHGAPKTTKAK